MTYKFVVNITKPQPCNFITYTDHITGKKVAQFSYLALEKQSNRNSIFMVKKHSLSTGIYSTASKVDIEKQTGDFKYLVLI